VKFARYDYGAVSIESRLSGGGSQPRSVLVEKQMGYLTGATPSAPKVEVTQETATVARGAVLVAVTTAPQRYPLTGANVTSLSKALQPIPLPAP
jgi:hypothetical protein